ncbi:MULTISPECIES: hypothetical protein [unclassified Mesorhizobium]|uniref:hypothetical protein n=1 Tax=unclassified Mesorhizobium TaxID=325217 RepID=UPI0033364B6D
MLAAHFSASRWRQAPAQPACVRASVSSVLKAGAGTEGGVGVSGAQYHLPKDFWAAVKRLSMRQITGLLGYPNI